jgi:hypothetical protein
MKTLLIGVPEIALLATHPTAGATFTYALPAERTLGARYITWQVAIPTGGFSALSNSIALSVDGTTFTVVDTSTSATGEVRTYGPTSAPFVRIITTSHTPTTGDTDLLTISIII